MSLHIPVSHTSDTSVSVGRLYLCTPLCYTHGYDAVCIHLNSTALKDGFAPKGAELISLRKKPNPKKHINFWIVIQKKHMNFWIRNRFGLFLQKLIRYGDDKESVTA